MMPLSIRLRRWLGGESEHDQPRVSELSWRIYRGWRKRSERILDDPQRVLSGAILVHASVRVAATIARHRSRLEHELAHKASRDLVRRGIRVEGDVSVAVRASTILPDDTMIVEDASRPSAFNPDGDLSDDWLVPPRASFDDPTLVLNPTPVLAGGGNTLGVLVALDGSDIVVPAAGGVIGRSAAAADIVVPDEFVSLRHALLKPGVSAAVLEDTSSTNGTFVNDVRIGSPVTLSNGDRVSFGGRAVFHWMRRSADITGAPNGRTVH